MKAAARAGSRVGLILIAGGALTLFAGSAVALWASHESVTTSPLTRR